MQLIEWIRAVAGQPRLFKQGVPVTPPATRFSLPSMYCFCIAVIDMCSDKGGCNDLGRVISRWKALELVLFSVFFHE